MSESTTVFEKMTALADAVRKKTLAAGPLSIDKMTEEISALKNGTLGSRLDCGSFKIDEERELGNFAIPHALGDIPNFVICYNDNEKTKPGTARGFISINLGKYDDEYYGIVGEYVSNRLLVDYESSVNVATANQDVYDNADFIYAPIVTSTRKFDRDATYYWVAFRYE